MTPSRVLVSARDPAAALHLAEICRAALSDARFDLCVVAQQPAYAILRGRGLQVRAISAAAASSKDDPAGSTLLAEAKLILEQFRPDVVLCGLSSPGEGGIDEALLAVSRVPTFLMQDFWGEQNTFFGRGADTLLVLDQAAAKLSNFRHCAKTIVTGSPRHGAYKDFDSLQSRVRCRSSLDIPLERKVIGLFGQPLCHQAGYLRTLSKWADAVRALPCHPVVVYRPHPRELNTGITWTVDELRRLGLSPIILASESTEEALSICDAACAVFSNCAYDAAYLNYFCDSPLVTPMMLLFDHEMAAFYSSIADFKQLPYFSEGLALPVLHADELDQAMIEAVEQPCRERAWLSAKAFLSDPSNSAGLVLSALQNAQ